MSKVEVSRVGSTGDFKIIGLKNNQAMGRLFSNVLAATSGIPGKGKNNSDTIYCKNSPMDVLLEEIGKSGLNLELTFDPKSMSKSQEKAAPTPEDSAADKKEEAISVVASNGKFYVNGLRPGKDGPSKWHEEIAKNFDGEINKQGNVTCKLDPSGFFNEKVLSILEKKGIPFVGLNNSVQQKVEENEENQNNSKISTLNVEKRASKNRPEFLVVVGIKKEDKVLQEHIKIKYGAKYNSQFNTWALNNNAPADELLSVKKDIIDVYLGKKEGMSKSQEKVAPTPEDSAADKKEEAISVVASNGKFYVNGLRPGKDGPSKWHEEIAKNFDGEINKQGNVTCKLDPSGFFNEKVLSILEKKGIPFVGLNNSVQQKVEDSESQNSNLVTVCVVAGYDFEISKSENAGKVYVKSDALKDIKELRTEFKEFFNIEKGSNSFSKDKGWEISTNENKVRGWLASVGEEIIEKSCSKNVSEDYQAALEQNQHQTYSQS